MRQLLDMRAGIAFDEDYLATSGPIIAYRKATRWNPLEPGDTPSDLRSFYREMTGSRAARRALPLRLAEHGSARLGDRARDGRAVRRSDERADLEAHGGRAQRLHHGRPVGRAAVRRRHVRDRADLARVGQLIVEGGRRAAADPPGSWIDDITRGGDPDAWAAGDFTGYFPGFPMRYRSQWYVLDGEAPILFGFGSTGRPCSSIAPAGSSSRRSRPRPCRSTPRASR